MNPPKDYRTAEAKKWAEDFIPPETCGSIDDVQNAMEHLRDANSQLRHVAHLWRHVALDELRRRRLLGETVTFSRARFAEIRRIAKLHDAPANLFAAIDECAADGLRFPAESGAAVVAAATRPVVSNGHQDAEPSALELIKIAADAMWDEYMKDECCDYVVINTLVESIRNVLSADHPTSKSRQADTEPEHADTARLDWLEMQCVEVRTPLAHGSRADFRTHPDDSYEGEEGPSDIRALIDARLQLDAGVGGPSEASAGKHPLDEPNLPYPLTETPKGGGS